MTAEPTIDELLDRAVQAINSGDRRTADALAERVLAFDEHNPDAEDLLAGPSGRGELRRLTMLFADLVDSTALSTRIEPEVYRTVVGRYRDEVIKIVNHYDGHLGSTKGDGLLAVFGHPRAHENDAQRAVHTGLDICRRVRVLSDKVKRRFGFEIDVRVGIHRGLVYLDIAQDDVYGLGANLAARMCGLADPGGVTVSETIERVVRGEFDTERRPDQTVKGVDEPVAHFRVVHERDSTGASGGLLIGRDDELSELRAHWNRAVTAAGPVGVALRGEAGIGKSRLAAAAVAIAEESGAAVLGLYGSPLHADVGLRPVRRLLERRCGMDRDEEPSTALAKLINEVETVGLDSTAVALLAPVLGIAADAGYEPASAPPDRLHDSIVTAVTNYLLAAGGDRPLLLLAEDLHWFDADTIAVVQQLLGSAHTRLLVVATSRKVLELQGITTIDVSPLGAAQSDELIEGLYPGLTPAARRSVQQRCDGIPLYIEEVVAKLQELPAGAADSAEVPDSLYEALIARLRSTKGATVIIEAAALIGGGVEKNLLTTVVDGDTDEVESILLELSRAKVMHAVGIDRWRFHHELLREAAAELTPPSIRRRLHSRIADAMLSTTENNPEWTTVAAHYEHASRFDEAHAAYRRASTNARQRGALHEARAHLDRALACVDGMPSGRSRDSAEVAVRLERGFLASAATGHASTLAAAEFERCLRLIGDEPTDSLLATFSALFTYYATRGDLGRAGRLVAALRRRHDELAPWQRVANDALAGSLAVFRGEFDSASAILEQAAVTAETIDTAAIEGAWFAPNDPVAALYTLVAFTRFVRGDLVGADVAFDQMATRCGALRFPHGPFTLCYGQSNEALVRAEAGQYDRAMALIGESAARSEQYGFDEWKLLATSAQTNAAVMGAILYGDHAPTALEAHVDTLTTLVDTWYAAEMVSYRAWYDASLARVLLVAGRLPEARDRIDRALRTANDTDWHIYDAELHRLRAQTFTDAEARRTALVVAAETARRQGALVFELRVAADAYALLGDTARAPFAEVLTRFPREQSWPELDRFRALLT